MSKESAQELLYRKKKKAKDWRIFCGFKLRFVIAKYFYAEDSIKSCSQLCLPCHQVHKDLFTATCNGSDSYVAIDALDFLTQTVTNDAGAT